MLKNALLALSALCSFAGCGQPEFQVVVPLAVINFAPADGAVDIATATNPTVCFNREMSTSVAAQNLQLETDSGAAVAAQAVVATPDAHCLTISHPVLAQGAGYVIHAKKGLAASDGTALATDITARFRTAVQL